MTINITIERLVLDGLAVDAHQGQGVGEGLRMELARLLGEGALRPGIATGAHVPRLDAGHFTPRSGARPEATGTALARSIAGVLQS